MMENGRFQRQYVREPARRVFAAEFRDADHQMRGDEKDEKSPTYVLLPTGELCNRIFIVGTLTEKQKQGEQNVIYRARISDPTGTFFIMAGSYQPEAMAQIAKIEPPNFVAVVGKPNVYERDDGQKFVSVRAESVTIVDKETRDLWILETARRTLDRIKGSGQNQDLAANHYRRDPKTYKQMVQEALISL